MPIGYIWLTAVTLLLCYGKVNCESRFLTLPESQSVIEGDSITFTCHATPVQGLEYSWTHNGQIIQNLTRVHQIGSNLHISNVIKDLDAGDYVCIATTISSGARQASPAAHLNIIWLRSASVQLLAVHKDEIVLKCFVDGSADHQIEWFRNSEKLTDVLHTNIHFEKNHLTIHNPSIYDNGQYTCIAANLAGLAMSQNGYILNWPTTTTSSIGITTTKAPAAPALANRERLIPVQNYISGCIPQNYLKNKNRKFHNVIDAKFLCRGKRGKRGDAGDGNLPNLTDLTFLQHPKKQTVVNENEHAELHCKHNLPNKYKTSQILLKWRKDGKIFRQIDLSQSVETSHTEQNIESMLREESRISISRQNGSLIFASVIASDSGIYSCQVFVDGNQPVTSEIGELSVIEQLKFAPQPTTSKNLELGSMGKIHCKAQGTPSPQVKWIRENYDQLPETIEDINGTLIFKNVSNENKGSYTCIATNSQGRINATVDVDVVIAPKFLVAPKGPIQALEMSMANFHCQAIGDPKPTIQWDKDLQYLSENNTDRNRFKFLENGTLQITEVHIDDEGRYGCTIGSSAGLKREEVRFIVKLAEGFVTEESNDGFMITRAVLITMSVAFAYIILVIGLMLWCRYRRQARKARLNSNNDKDNVESGVIRTADGQTGKNGEIEPCLPTTNDKRLETNGKAGKLKKVNGNNNPTRGSGNEAQKSDDTISSAHSRASKKSMAFEQLSVPRSSLTDLVQIGRGDFGDVFVGKIKTSVIRIAQIHEKDRTSPTAHSNEKQRRSSKGSMDNIEEITEEENSEAENEYKPIMVKALIKIKEENLCQEFKRQIDMFKSISHKGVVKLYGLCREKDPHYLILQYTDWGDLKQFLLTTAGKATTNSISDSVPPLQKSQMLALAYQIARGMDAIYRARFIHKDLAARNCIISSDFNVKISYPGLSKDKYNREYFKHRNTLLPIRWLAPECIHEDEYTTKSDIYAFGVLFWEIFMQATQLPFENLTNEEFLQQNSNGTIKWTCAENTPCDLQEIVASCWSPNPKDRPSFSQLCASFSKSMQSSDKS